MAPGAARAARRLARGGRAPRPVRELAGRHAAAPAVRVQGLVLVLVLVQGLVLVLVLVQGLVLVLTNSLDPRLAQSCMHLGHGFEHVR